MEVVVFYLPCNPWDGVKQREQHLCEKLSAYCRVYYVQLSGELQWNVGFKEIVECIRWRQFSVNENLSIVSLPRFVVPHRWGSLRLLHRWGEWYMYFFLSVLMRRQPEGSDIILGTGFPRFPWAFRKAPASLRYYDCMDNHPAFDKASAGLLRSREIQVERAADCIFVSAEKLKQLSPGRRAAILVTNGVDPEEFGDARVSRPADLPRPRPIIGYCGVVSSWFDFQTVGYAAKQRPEYQFVIVGPVDRQCKHSLTQLCTLKNVHWLGRKAKSLLKDYLAFFDVATIPFLLNDVTSYVNPTKMYEYFYMNRHVLASDLPEVSKFRPYVQIYKDANEFVRSLDSLVVKKPNTRLRAIAAANSWDRKAETIFSSLQEALRRKANEARPSTRTDGLR